LDSEKGIKCMKAQFKYKWINGFGKWYYCCYNVKQIFVKFNTGYLDIKKATFVNVAFFIILKYVIILM
jgi:hypothetical protein